MSPKIRVALLSIMIISLLPVSSYANASTTVTNSKNDGSILLAMESALETSANKLVASHPGTSLLTAAKAILGAFGPKNGVDVKLLANGYTLSVTGDTKNILTALYTGNSVKIVTKGFSQNTTKPLDTNKTLRLSSENVLASFAKAIARDAITMAASSGGTAITKDNLTNAINDASLDSNIKVKQSNLIFELYTTNYPKEFILVKFDPTSLKVTYGTVNFIATINPSTGNLSQN